MPRQYLAMSTRMKNTTEGTHRLPCGNVEIPSTRQPTIFAWGPMSSLVPSILKKNKRKGPLNLRHWPRECVVTHIRSALVLTQVDYSKLPLVAGGNIQSQFYRLYSREVFNTGPEGPGLEG